MENNSNFDSFEKKYMSKNRSSKKEFSFSMQSKRSIGLSMHGKPKNAKKTISRLFSYLKKEKWLLFFAITSSLICATASLASSYLLRPLINKFIYYNPEELNIEPRLVSLAKSLGLLAIVYAISIFNRWLQARLMLTISQRSLKRMRMDLYKKLQRLPLSYFDGHISGDIMSRFTNDIDLVGEMLNTTLIQIISGFIAIIGTICLMIYTNWILGIITIITTPVLLFASKTIIKYGKHAYSEQQKNLGILNGFIEETISGQKVVKVFGHEEKSISEFEYVNQKMCQSQVKAQFQSGIIGPITHQICNLSYAITACVGGLLVVSKGFDIGGLTISLNFTRRFNRPINEISMQMNTIFSALAGAERVFEVLDEKEEEDGKDEIKLDKIQGNIELQNVNFGYTTDNVVLHDISLSAKPGQKIAFIGSTGAGKTTVTNLLSRFYDTSSGKILIDGIDIEKINRKFLRKNIAVVLQDTHLFTGTIMENIRYGRLDATDEEVIETAKITSAHEFISKLEKGYDTVLEKDGANLSQGQRQLITIARAGISNAPILILDEATSAVDTRTEKYIENGMKAIMKNRTTFVIAHRLSTVVSSDVIMVLENGRIVERGNHNELLSLHGRYYDLYNEIINLD